MRTPIENSNDFISLESEVPKELREFAELINKFRWKYRYDLNHNIHSFSMKEMFGKRDAVEDIGKVIGLLDTIVWQFLAIVRKASETISTESKENEHICSDLEEDLSNVMSYLGSSLESLFTGPSERLNHGSLVLLSRALAMPFNSLIGLVLIDAWKNSRRPMEFKDIDKERLIRILELSSYEIEKGKPDSVREKRRLRELKKEIRNKYICDYNIFVEEMYKSLKYHRNIFRKQLYIIMPRGKIQTTFLPQIPIGQRALGPLEKVEGQTPTEIESSVPIEQVFEQELPDINEMIKDIPDEEGVNND